MHIYVFHDRLMEFFINETRECLGTLKLAFGLLHSEMTIPSGIASRSYHWFSIRPDGSIEQGKRDDSILIPIWGTEPFVIHENPGDWSSHSARSSALYPASLDRGHTDLDLSLEDPNQGGGYLLQILDARRGPVVTSTHCHHDTEELFFPLLGSTDIWTPSGTRRLNWATCVQTGIRHQLIVPSGIAINLINMKGPYPVRFMGDHFYT